MATTTRAARPQPPKPDPAGDSSIRPVPSDVDAEEAVLGALLIDDEAVEKVAAVVQPEDFYREVNGWVYQACLDLNKLGTKVNQITVAHRLVDAGRLEACGGVAYLSQLVAMVPTSVHAVDYAEIVVDASLKRRLISVGSQIANVAYDGQGRNATALLEIARQQLAQVEARVSGAAATKPAYTMSRVGLGYRFEYPARRVEILIDHLRREGDGLKGEITVLVNIPLVSRDLHWSALNLSAADTRKRLAGQLDSRAKNLGIPWDEMLNEVCRQIARTEREGEPVTEIGTLPAREQETWLLRRFCPMQEVTTLFGEGSAGKSRLALALGLSVQTGLTFVPPYDPLATGPILYLDWETRPYSVDARVKQLCAGMDLEPVSVKYKRCKGALADQIEEVLKLCERSGVVFVVVDSMQMAMAGGETRASDPNEPIFRFYAALRFLDRTVLIVDHVSKAAAGENKPAGHAYGGIYKGNLPRMTYELRCSQEPAEETEEGTIHLAVHNQKRNDGGTKFKAVGLRVDFNAEWTKYGKEDVDAPDLVANLPLTQRIPDILKRGPLSAKEIIEMTGAKEMTVRGELSKGLDKKYRKLPDGRYGLAETKRDEAGAGTLF